MPPKMGLRVSSCFHNAFSAVDCQEISGRFWPVAPIAPASHPCPPVRGGQIHEHNCYLQPSALEQRKICRTEIPALPEKPLGDPGEATNRRENQEQTKVDRVIHCDGLGSGRR